MGSQELLDYFRDYAALKARHSYGPRGHRGISVLIFETSAAGYLEAVRLHKHFKQQGRDREAWNRCKNPFVPGGKRQLYGYLASREDMDNFNRHSGGFFLFLLICLLYIFGSPVHLMWYVERWVEINHAELEDERTLYFCCSLVV